MHQRTQDMLRLVRGRKHSCALKVLDDATETNRVEKGLFAGGITMANELDLGARHGMAIRMQRSWLCNETKRGNNVR